jgi:hypothetical protein
MQIYGSCKSWLLQPLVLSEPRSPCPLLTPHFHRKGA